MTGATKGIGLGIARGLAEAKYRVHITGRTETGTGSLEAAKALILEAGGECVSHRVDHSNPQDVASVFDAIFAAEPNGVDLLVNNASPVVNEIEDVLRSGKAKFWEQPPSSFAAINDVGSPERIVQAHYTLQKMVPKGRGLIVMVSSPGGLFYFFTAAYSTGKAALDRLMSDLAHELRGTGVGCVGLWPGLVATEKFQVFAKDGLWGMSPESLQKEAETPLYSGRRRRDGQ